MDDYIKPGYGKNCLSLVVDNTSKSNLEETVQNTNPVNSLEELKWAVSMNIIFNSYRYITNSEDQDDFCYSTIGKLENDPKSYLNLYSHIIPNTISYPTDSNIITSDFDIIIDKVMESELPKSLKLEMLKYEMTCTRNDTSITSAKAKRDDLKEW